MKFIKIDENFKKSLAKKVAGVKNKLKGFKVKGFKVKGLVKKPNLSIGKLASESKGKLALISGHTPPGLVKAANKLRVVPKIAIATYYRAAPKSRREQKFYFFILFFILVIVGGAIAAGVVYGNSKLKPIGQDKYKFNIPFFLGTDSLWNYSSDSTKHESSFGTKLNTHIELEYSYNAKNYKTTKPQYTIIDLSKKINYGQMKKQMYPMDISQPLEIYVYNDIGGKDIHFIKDAHNVLIPKGKDVMKYTETPGTCIYPSVYVYTDQNNVATTYNCHEIVSSVDSAANYNAYSGIPLFTGINMESISARKSPVTILKGKNPVFGMYITNYVNYYEKPDTFSREILGHPVPPTGILIPSLSLVISYFIAAGNKENPTIDDEILNGNNYVFDSAHYTESSALWWREK